HVLAVVTAWCVERRRDHGDEQLDLAQRQRRRRAGVAVERVAGHLRDRAVLDQTEGDRASRLEAAPLHGRCSSRKLPTSRLNTSGRSKYVEWPAASTRTKREPGTRRWTVSESSGQMRPSSSLVRNSVGTRAAA